MTLGACALALVGVTCFVAGRATARPVEVERIVTVQATAEAKSEAREEAKATTLAAATDTGKVVTRWKVKRVVVAGNCVEEAEGERTEARNAVSTVQADTATVATVRRDEKASIGATVVLPSERDRYSLGARAGMTPGGAKVWGFEGAVRLADWPVWIGAWVEIPGNSGGALLRVSW